MYDIMEVLKGLLSDPLTASGLLSPVGNTSPTGTPPTAGAPPMMSNAEQTRQRDLSKNLIGQRGNRITPVGPEQFQATHWSQGVADMLGVLQGRRMSNNVERATQGDIRSGIPRLPNQQPPGAMTSQEPSVPRFQPTVPPELARPNRAPGRGATTNTDPIQRASLGSPPPQSEQPSDYDNRLIMIESGDNPEAVNRSGRNRGLGQFSRALERRYGITDANWTDPNIQRAAIRRHTDENREHFRTTLGREPTDGELYLMHQQGIGGGTALIQGGDRPAVEVLRPFYRNPATALSAIRDNLPRGGGDPNTITASQFARLWTSRFPGANAAPPQQVAANDLGTEPPATPPAQDLGNEPRLEDVGPAVAANQPEITQVADRGPPLPRDTENRPIDRRALEATNPNIHMQPDHPPPIPADLGMNERQWFGILNLPHTEREAALTRMREQYTPQFTEVPGGKRWLIPATGATGFIPTPRIGTFEGMETETTTDRFGRRRTHLNVPGGAGGDQPDTPPAIRPRANVPPGNETVQPPLGPDSPVEPQSGLVEDTLVPPLQNIQDTQPPAARDPFESQYSNTPTGRSPLRHPLLEDKRNIILEQEFRQGTDNTRREALKETINRSPEAEKTMELARMIQELENMPGADGVMRGPLGPRALQLQQFWNGIFGTDHGLSFNSNTVITAEMLQKMNTMLAGQAAKMLTNRPTQFDFQTYLANNPGLLTSRGGSRFMAQLIENLAQTEIDLANRAWQVSERGLAVNWPQIKNEVYRNSRIIINGTVVDRRLGNIQIDQETGEIVPRDMNRGAIMGAPDGRSYQYTGRTGNREEWRNRNNWAPVNPREPRTWRIQPDVNTPAPRRPQLRQPDSYAPEQ